MARSNGIPEKTGTGARGFYDTGNNAFTGLEAALVLIAFVVVAAIFSYVILNTGFMTTQKSQSAVFNAVEQTTSTLEIYGNVYGIGEEDSYTHAYRIIFTCSIASSGSPVDFEKVVLTYSNESYMETLDRDPATYNPAGCSKNSGTWAISEKNTEKNPANNLLEPSEQYVITACPSQPIIADDSFTLEVKPAIGVAMSISRTLPPEVKPVNILY